MSNFKFSCNESRIAFERYEAMSQDAKAVNSLAIENLVDAALREAAFYGNLQIIDAFPTARRYVRYIFGEGTKREDGTIELPIEEKYFAKSGKQSIWAPKYVQGTHGRTTLRKKATIALQDLENKCKTKIVLQKKTPSLTIDKLVRYLQAHELDDKCKDILAIAIERNS